MLSTHLEVIEKRDSENLGFGHVIYFLDNTGLPARLLTGVYFNCRYCKIKIEPML